MIAAALLVKGLERGGPVDAFPPILDVGEKRLDVAVPGGPSALEGR